MLGLAAGQTTVLCQPAADLTELSLEDLLTLRVTSVTRHEQQLSQSSSAIYVIQQEDIRRSGVTTIPDALRLAPGVQVAQIDTNKWAVGIRGFVGRFTNKLLVMIDGRSVYQALGGGVYWEANEVLLEDVDRIEVIRGPGATMWGSNAVNGVINIITKHTRDTRGGLVTAGGGNQQGAYGNARFGSSVGPQLHYRFYSTYSSPSGQLLPSGDRAPDNLVKTQGGFRVDWEPSKRNSFLISGDIYEGDAREQQRIFFPESRTFSLQVDRAEYTGANLMARWTHKHSSRSTSEFQVYYDHSTRNDLVAHETSVDIVDAEYQHQSEFSRHRLMTGVGYRRYADSTPAVWWHTFEPNEWTSHRYNFFVQDEIVLLPGKLLLTMGSKFEHNVYSGWEVQPSASLLWNRSPRDVVWLSAARAARTPSRVNRQIRTPLFAAPGPQGATILGELQGSDAFSSEYLNAYEAGYRVTPVRRVSFDLTTFYNVYDGLARNVEAPPFVRAGTPPTIVRPTIFQNRDQNVSMYGAEAAASWRVLEAAQLRLSYSYLRGGVPTNDAAPGTGHRIHGRWFWTLPGRVEWDSSYYFVDGYSGVPSYHRVDSRLGWRPAGRYEFSVVVQNLLDDRHREAPPILVTPNEIGRSVYGRLSWRF